MKIIDFFDTLMKDKYASGFFYIFKVGSITMQMNIKICYIVFEILTITLGRTCNKFGHNEHPANTSR